MLRDVYGLSSWIGGAEFYGLGGCASGHRSNGVLPS